MPDANVTWVLVVAATAFVLLMVPVSISYDRKYRAVVHEYAELRCEHGAADREWPPPRLRMRVFLNPALMLSAALLAALLSVYGALDEFLRTDPFGQLPGFVPDPRLSALVPALVAGAVLSALLAAYAVSGFVSPWWPVQLRLRLAAAAQGERRQRLLGQALSSDPTLPHDGSHR